MHMQQPEEVAASNWLKEIQKGYIRIAALMLLSKKPHHGYELMKEIKVKTHGFWKPTAGGIYPVLKDLQKSGYVQSEWDTKTKRRKKIYRITESGEDVLRRVLAKENQLRVNMRALVEEYMKSVLEVDSKLELPLKMPLALAELLKEPDENKEDTIRRLEEQRSIMRETIKQLQKNLRIIDKRIQSLSNNASQS